MSADAKVGIVVILGGVIFALAAAFLSPYWGWWGGYDVVAYFEDSQGVTQGTPVRIAGVTIGVVKTVNLQPLPPEGFAGRRAEVRLHIPDEKTMLYETDRFRIEAGSLLGEKFINVIRTTSEPRGPLTHESAVPGETAVGVPELLSESAQLVTTVNDVVATVRDVIGDPAIVADIKGAVSELRGLTTDLRAQVAEGRIERILDDLASTSAVVRTKMESADIESVVENLNQAIEDGRELLSAMSAEDIRSAVANVRDMTENVKAAALALQVAVIESGMLQDAQATMASMRRISGEIEETAKYLREQVTDEEKLETVENILANTEELTERGLEISDDLAEVVSTGKDAVATAQRLAEGMEERLERSRKPLRKIVVNPRVEMSVGSRTGDVLLDADLFFGKKESPSQFLLGLRDLGGATDVNLQFARRVSPDLRIRGGLISGGVGAAADAHFTGPWGGTVEAYEDGADWRIDLTGAYDFGTGLSGIFGFDDVFGGVDPFVGSRYEW